MPHEDLSQSVPATQSPVCPTCHQGIKPEYYFCPNCGTMLHQAPLSTEPLAQFWIYAFSIILPMIAFLFVTRWPGMKYYRSEDPKARLVGQVAWVLLVLSTIGTSWYIYNWTQNAVNTAVNNINTDMSF
ncbi:MAG: hypothetical protein JWM46_872 [Candidatus Kaiserbacteria bacterium]|nr:hypothetical protein [Candidatus Kaiserbacteria bacterium]